MSLQMLHSLMFETHALPYVTQHKDWVAQESFCTQMLPAISTSGTTIAMRKLMIHHDEKGFDGSFLLTATVEW